jgi:hypothetical protein
LIFSSFTRSQTRKKQEQEQKQTHRDRRKDKHRTGTAPQDACRPDTSACSICYAQCPRKRVGHRPQHHRTSAVQRELDAEKNEQEGARSAPGGYSRDGGDLAGERNHARDDVRQERQRGSDAVAEHA